MTRPLLAIQQLQLATVLGTEARARAALCALAKAGYEGIELNGFMTRPTPLVVRGLTRLAGMPAGRGGRYDWVGLVRESGLAVVGLHEDLGTLEQSTGEVVRRAASFGTRHVVVPGVYRFDFGDTTAVDGLAERLNRVGQALAGEGLRLLYHNHNAELVRLSSGATAFERLIERTDPDALGFEFDAYWPTVAGADAVALLKSLGERVAMLHLTDRGTRRRGPYLTPILKADSVELGTGTMPLDALVAQAASVGVEAVIVETHRNWVDGDPLASAAVSAAWLGARLKQEVPR